uniref:Uncharacterized protein n=1 Tax=Gouania willdenowi TaxID=441366 RepID=A0A8C5GNV3_GOUWI
MESPPDPASGDPGNGASEPATPVRETPVNLETLRKSADSPVAQRRSSTRRLVLTHLIPHAHVHTHTRTRSDEE